MWNRLAHKDICAFELQKHVTKERLLIYEQRYSCNPRIW